MTSGRLWTINGVTINGIKAHLNSANLFILTDPSVVKPPTALTCWLYCQRETHVGH